ncbi:hypothetical protein, partial [uncultured Ilumatobacter sp.]|uniref:hypothetical protein n=1 Tax=uncultured Ilumatobacter sp. TaxID=879968 RepID=UPI00374F359A
MMDQVFGEPFSANEYDADPMVAMSELERAIQDRLAEHELRFTAARRAIVDELKSATGPITLPELLDAAPDLARPFHLGLKSDSHHLRS